MRVSGIENLHYKNFRYFISGIFNLLLGFEECLKTPQDKTGCG
jgi:hypothetical protein